MSYLTLFCKNTFGMLMYDSLKTGGITPLKKQVIFIFKTF